MLKEVNINLKEYRDLTYYETDLEYIDLYNKDKFVGHLEVWTDRQNENREYIIINSEIIYLDIITKRND